MAIEFHYDYASPWSYFADELIPRKLAGVNITYRPMYLRGLDAFSSGLPYTQAKAVYIMRDMHRCAEDEGIDFRFPDEFPVNGLYALRGALWVQQEAPERFAQYHKAMFRATWVENRPIGQKAVVVEIAGAAGLDAEAFAAGIERADIKERLKTDTAKAQERGVFGAPTFFDGDEMFWGHDRMEALARHLARKGTSAI